MSHFSLIKCNKQNHNEMNYEYVCLKKNCIDYNKELCCFYCCEEQHDSHRQFITTIKEIVLGLHNKYQSKDSKVRQILLQGMKTCRTAKELQINLSEIIALLNGQKRYQNLIDQEMKLNQSSILRHYQRIRQAQTARTVSQKSTMMYKSFITPILNFKENVDYTLNSPFSITNNKNELITAFAYPSLSKLTESTNIKIRVDRYTPSWLGIGFSIGQHKYEEKSVKHLIAISNGWISNKGVIQKSKVRFRSGEEVYLKWDKNLQVVQIRSIKGKETIRFENRWNEQVYVCICLFYKGDGVSILV